MHTELVIGIGVIVVCVIIGMIGNSLVTVIGA